MIFGSRNPGNPTIVEPELKLPSLPADSVNTGNNTLKMATEAEAAGDYSKALILINEAIEQGISADWTFGQAFAYNMRGTYKFVDERRKRVLQLTYLLLLAQIHARRLDRCQGRL